MPPVTTRTDDEVEALRRQVARLVRENEKQQRRLEFLIRLVALLRSGGVDLTTRSRLVQENQQLGVRWLCQVLHLDRRHLYRSRCDRQEHGRRVAADEQLAQLITEVHARSGGTCTAQIASLPRCADRVWWSTASEWLGSCANVGSVA